MCVCLLLLLFLFVLFFLFFCFLFLLFLCFFLLFFFFFVVVTAHFFYPAVPARLYGKSAPLELGLKLGLPLGVEGYGTGVYFPHVGPIRSIFPISVKILATTF